ncbi:hypothetical protein BRARA_H01497 [Brassica rapa]|uniref:Clu domain-containing protein n=2 Tax=Brassica campestris TaxID=3711 RepID=A0A397YBG9_BRACM|nr:hypothetical protein BRARA_H01497 [Brassica rapa]
MAPKAGKTKPHKSKGDKKKKEEKVLPIVIEISIETPDETQVTLKGISTDRILDVRKLLAVHVQTCHFTNFSLSHQVRGARLKDSVDIVSLKPCHLTIVEEDYTEEQATAHIRRLLDIVACTTAFGSSKPPVSRASPKESGSNEDAGDSGSNLSPKSEKKLVIGGCEASPAAEGGDKGEINMSPPIRLGQFYEFISFSHLTPPIQYIRRSVRPSIEDKGVDDLFQIDVKVSSGKPITVVASRTGFFPAGKQQLLCHSLVELLQQISRPFDAAYDALMKAFIEHNKFANLPYGFRANTWVVPPVVRDRKAFLLHSLFVDVSVSKAVEIIKNVVEGNQRLSKDPAVLGFHEERVGDLVIRVARDDPDASAKLDRKSDGTRVLEISQEELAQRNLLKGITADESATVHDTSTLGVVVVRHCGFTAIVKVAAEYNLDGGRIPQDIDIEDQSEGGANALNVNSLRTLLHKSSTPSSTVQRSPNADSEQIRVAKSLVRTVFEDSLQKLEAEPPRNTKPIRWELGACWVQHLANEASSKTESKNTEDAKPEPPVKDASISSKGHLSVSDLLDYITPETDLKARDAQRKARMKVKGRPGQSPTSVLEENQKDDEILTPTPITVESSSDKDNKSEAKPEETKVDKRVMEPRDQVTLVKAESTAQEDDSSDEGWQEAVPKNRYPSGRRTRPSLAKLNTNFTNANQQTSKSRGKPTNFASPRTSPNEISISAAGSTSQHAKKALKSPSLNKKKSSSNIVGEKPVSNKSATEQINKPISMVSPVTVQAGKLFSYKEVALAPPGTIVKIVAEQLTEETTVPETLDAAKVDGPEKVKAEEDESESKHEATETENADGNEQGGAAVGGSKLMSLQEDIKAEKAGEEGSPTKTAVSDASRGISESVQTAKDSNGSGPVTELKQHKDVSDATAKAVDGETEALPNGDLSPKSSVVADGEKQEACEAQKETSKKLSASAPPYTPTTIPIFGSITVPGFNDHVGILPSPVNIPPMLPVNHVRRSTPHQSVTARVPYGPRLSGGGFNRSGNRVPRNKPSFPISPESNGEAKQFIGPRIMNPHAAEFIPSQPWVSNGYPVSPNGYLVSPNGTEITQNGYPLSPVAGAYPCNIPAQPQNGHIIPAPVALEEVHDTESAEEKSGGEEESNKENKAAEDEEVTAQETTETPENGQSAAGEEKPTAQEISDEN